MSMVTLRKYLENSGESRSRFYDLREQGEYLEGVHYHYDKRGKVWIDDEAMAAWVRGEKPKRSRRVA
ncbi:hypothetical protein GCM10011348_46460 [Marinobacterium nitratireducens]|uniref:Excisionase n=1 Tax=Marinobacterium nitratireducens TaxID=518897 RepID=A0A917ZQS4_9GAMM|nr:hypothetical protein [Marinobacterium nitratireducens]GGO89220.1 hypothetical protein GCM10011348_46460 [Marinobacterium nitratireducens]